MKVEDQSSLAGVISSHCIRLLFRPRWQHSINKSQRCTKQDVKGGVEVGSLLHVTVKHIITEEFSKPVTLREQQTMTKSR